MDNHGVAILDVLCSDHANLEKEKINGYSKTKAVLEVSVNLVVLCIWVSVLGRTYLRTATIKPLKIVVPTVYGRPIQVTYPVQDLSISIVKDLPLKKST